MNIIDHDFLLPGHVFSRPDGSTSRLLFITNVSLGKKASAKFPPQVVYADENNQVFSRDIPGFLESREFVNVDPELEAKLNALLKSDTEHPEDELDLDGDDDQLMVSGIDEIDDMLTDMGLEIEPSDEGSEIEEPDTVDVPSAVAYVAVNEGVPQALTAEQLASATVSYEQSIDNGNLLHTLCIRAGDGITKALLEQSFNPLYQDAYTMYAPKVVIEGQNHTFDWDVLVGIYPAVFYDSQIYKVILQSNPVPDAPEAVVLNEDEALAALETAVEQPVDHAANLAAAVQASGAVVTVDEIDPPAPVAVQAQPAVVAAVATPAAA